MKNIKIGFVPAHREPFDEVWAEKMRSAVWMSPQNIEGLEIVVPDAKTDIRGSG